MRTVVLRGPRDIVLEDRPMPRPADREVLVQVRAVGVCGSDTHYYEHGRIGNFVVESPLVLGHEASGVIVGVGHGVSEGRVGERVSIEPGVPDMTCPQCLSGRYNLCPSMRFFATPPIDGAFAEYVTVHESFAHVVPSNISDEGAALLEPLSVGVWSCRKGAVAPGSRVLITGAGAIGLISMQCALASGATEVVVSDINPVRLALAKELGATAVIDAGEGGLGELDMAPDVLIECSGHPPAIGEAISKLAPAGRAVLVGMGGDEIRLPLAVVQQREIVVTGTFRYANTWPTAISLVASGRISLDRLVTGRYRLDEAEAALVSSRDDKTAVKAVVYPQK